MKDFNFVMVGISMCIVSCLLLLIPFVRRWRRTGLDVFCISGIPAVLGYTYAVAQVWYYYSIPFGIEIVLSAFNILLMVWLYQLAKKNYGTEYLRTIENEDGKALVRRFSFSMIVFVGLCLFSTLFYKTVCAILLCWLWRKDIATWMPERMRGWGMKLVWGCLMVVLWIGMPRYRVNSGDRVRLVYFDKSGNAMLPPLGQYIVNTLFPEEEIVHIGINSLRVCKPVLHYLGIGQGLIRQANDDIASGKIQNFYAPYDSLGMENPMSGVYAQVFNEKFHASNRAAYIINPQKMEEDATYPLVVFCHGYLGNWQLYNGVWKGLDNAIVLSIGTRGLDGIFNAKDIGEIFSFYIPALERMGYHVDKGKVHLIGLSNGGSAVISVMHSAYAKRFKSITTVSCNLEGLRKVPCQVNFIGGGKDNSSKRMTRQCKQLQEMGVDAAIFYDMDENHFILVNRRDDIILFLKRRLGLIVYD